MPIPIIDDILKGLPENSNLRAHVAVLIAKIAELEAEVASLKDDLREHDIEISALKKKNQQLTHVDDDPASTILEIADYLKRTVRGLGDTLVRFDVVAQELHRKPIDISGNFAAAAEKASVEVVDKTNTHANCRRSGPVFV